MRALVTSLILLAGCDRVFGLEDRKTADAVPADARICEPGTPFGPGEEVAIEGRYSVEAARFDPMPQPDVPGNQNRRAVQ